MRASGPTPSASISPRWRAFAGCARRGPKRRWPRTKRRPPVAIQFSLDRPIDAAAAPFVMAATGGLFSAEGLAVTTNIASGSPDAIARVAAGTSDFALVDINALVRFRDKDKQGVPPVKAVFVLFNKAPYAIIARKSRGIHALSDIEGKNLGVAEGDLSIRLWPAVAKQNGIKTRERQAEQHQRRGARADAVGGPDRRRHRIFLSVGDQSEGPRRAGRRSRGTAIRRLWLRGLWLCRHRQSGAGGRQARSREGICAGGDRRHASRRSRTRHARRPRSSAAWTAARAIWNSNGCAAILRDNILTGEVKRNGIGGIDPARFERSIDQLAEDFKFQKRPQPRIFSTTNSCPRSTAA